jgi:hypothetical protein
MIFPFTIKATVREAVANAEISKEKEIAETRSRFAGSGAGEIGRSEYSNVEERPTDVRSRHYRIRRVVLFGAAFSFQPNGRPSIPDQSRTKAIRTVNDQLASRGCPKNCLRGSGFRVAESGTGCRHSPCEGSSPVDFWTESAQITTGRVFRSINKAGRIWGNGMTPKVFWEVVKDAAARAGIEKLAPHDLRRTCARLCHLAGGELDQIQFLLGHVSIQTTERNLGCKQKLRIAVNDNIGLEPAEAS